VTCQTPILLEDVELFLNDAELVGEMKKLLEWNPRSQENEFVETKKKSKKKKKKKSKKKHSDSDSDSESHTGSESESRSGSESGTGSESDSNSDSGSGSSDSESSKDPFFHCFNYEKNCDGKVKKNKKKKIYLPKM